MVTVLIPTNSMVYGTHSFSTVLISALFSWIGSTAHIDTYNFKIN